MSDQHINPYAPPTNEEEELVVAQLRGPLSPTEFADIRPVPEQDHGQTYTLSHVIIMNVLGGSPLLFMIGGGALIYYDWYQGLNTFSGSLIAAGVLSIVVGIIFGSWYQFLLEALYSSWKFRSAVRKRPSSIVNPDDHDLVFIGLSLREHWEQIKLDTCHDIGLLKLNPSTSSVFIESDKERFQIPKNSLFLCEPELFTHPVDMASEFWLIRLVVQLPEESREILIGLSHTDFKPRSNSIRKAKANQLCQQIMDMK